MEHVGSSSEDRSTPIPHQFKTSKPHETNAFEGGENTENTTNEQILRPVIPRAGAMEVTNKILGNSLNGLGYGAGIALAPITVPLGLLGAGFAYTIGKGMEKLMDAPPENAAKTGVKIGGSLPYLVTGVLVSYGDSLIGKAKEMKQDRKGIPGNEPEVKQGKTEIKHDISKASDQYGVREKLDEMADRHASIMNQASAIRENINNRKPQNPAATEEFLNLISDPSHPLKNFKEFYESLNIEIRRSNKAIELSASGKSLATNFLHGAINQAAITDEAYLQAIVKDRDNSVKVDVPQKRQDEELVINEDGDGAVSGEASEPAPEASEVSEADVNGSGEDIPITPFNMASDQYGVREKLDEAREAYKNGKFFNELKAEDFPKNFSEVVRFLNSEIRNHNLCISKPFSGFQEDLPFIENRTNEAYLVAVEKDKPISQKKLDEMADRHASIMNQASAIRENIANRIHQEPAATEEFLNLISDPSHPLKNFKEFYESLNIEIRRGNSAIKHSTSDRALANNFLKGANEQVATTDAAYEKAIEQDKNKL